jgi:hypothetical protein
VTIAHYEQLATLPFFNPGHDGEGDRLPTEVQALRDAVGRSDADRFSVGVAQYESHRVPAGVQVTPGMSCSRRSGPAGE